jgi:predicted Fe-S protein YdhL (DUF1289 family)
VSHLDLIDVRLDELAKERFRAKFHLRGRERAMLEQKGLRTVRRHAADLIGGRLARANPYKDGRQTPYRGHPVFVAQHATATCCRTCLRRWHEIPKGRELTASERDYVLDVIERWMERELNVSD